MDGITQFIAKQIEPLWHRPVIGVSVSLGLGLSAAFSLGIKTGIGQATGLFTFGFVQFVWIYLHRIPKTDRDKIGICVAIAADDENESRQVEADFVTSLRASLRRDVNGRHFQISTVSSHRGIEINQDPEKGLKYLTRSRSHFMLFGQARKRNLDGKSVHVLNLECAVRHAPISAEVQKLLAVDMRQALPPRFMIHDEGAFVGFEVASQLVDLAARYVVGVAAYISGAVGFAEQVLLDVEQQLRRIDVGAGEMIPLARAVPDRLKEIYLRWLLSVSDAHLRSRSADYVPLLEHLSTKVLERDPRNYHALCLKAMSQFLSRRDVAGALSTLRQCRGIKDAAWRYGVAFIHAYHGDLDKAHDEYRRAFKQPQIDATVPLQCEDFIQRILDAEPHNEQLHFCLALINYNTKKDLIAARRDFENFLRSEYASKFPHLADLSRSLIERCQVGESC